MADRIIKSDSGNDVVIQNNGGTRKIEVTNSGDVEVTGDFKATTVKATNLKANDGTAGLVVADSTGRVTFNESNPVITLGTNTTFPSGHVIQTVVEQNKTGGTAYDPATLQMTITGVASSNDVVGYFWSMSLYAASGAIPYISGIDTGDTYSTIPSGHNGFWAIHFVDTSPTAGSNTYTFQGYSAINYLCAAGGYGYGYVLQEIKR